MDRYFTSMTISEYLLDKGMTVVGTMRSDRAGIPKEMKETKSRESPSTLYVCNTDIKSVSVSYVIIWHMAFLTSDNFQVLLFYSYF